MDEDGGDGPRRAAGEAEDGHSEHRWVTTAHCRRGRACVRVERGTYDKLHFQHLCNRRNEITGRKAWVYGMAASRENHNKVCYWLLLGPQRNRSLLYLLRATLLSVSQESSDSDCVSDSVIFKSLSCGHENRFSSETQISTLTHLDETNIMSGLLIHL